ncbi:UDP-N-acetylmuramoyl-tripeptide--D-alanyl-D-alanine ligase [Patescibacteria group bacterium]|nr:UDP-N-acetylmuramoyl-tripeptide--D-alanyl-D-alanine ligase [Patescibacteria group bacterium]
MKDLIRRAVVTVMTMLARAVVRRYQPRIILVTGSVGKTSTKDALFATMKPKFFVRKSQKSFNSDIGVPLAVLGVPNGWGNPLRWIRNMIEGALLVLIRAPYPEWLIVEVGADRPGDITTSLAWLRPRIVVATRFPAVPVHVEFYDSPEAVRAEELAPLSWLLPGGVAVVNADDESVIAVPLADGVDRLTYGFHPKAHVRASRFKTLTEDRLPRGISFDVSFLGEKVHVVLPGVTGRGHAYAALGAIAGALAAEVPLEVAARGLAEYEEPPSRMRLIEGVHGSMLIDDTYNASPAAVTAALETLAEIPHTGRRIAVLADMLELGAYSPDEHEKAGALAARSADIVLTVGVRARKIADAARASGMAPESVLSFDTALDAAQHLERMVGAGDIVLAKGSQGMRMERVVKALMAEPERAKELVCRQDAEWLVR